MVEALGVTPGSVTAFALINDADHRVRFVLDARPGRSGVRQLPPSDQHRHHPVSREGFRRFLAALGVDAVIVDFAACTPMRCAIARRRARPS